LPEFSELFVHPVSLMPVIYPPFYQLCYPLIEAENSRCAVIVLPLFYSHYTGYRTIYISWHPQLRTREFFGAKFYCPHTIADGS